MALETSSCQKYGIPIYGSSWVPHKVIYSEEKSEQQQQQQPGGDTSEDESKPSIEPKPSIESHTYLVFAGGGGEGRSGIPNSILISHFDFASNSLSDQPVANLGTGADLPYRMAVHPGGQGLICSFPKSCSWYEWDEVEGSEVHKLGLKSSERVLIQLDDVGQQLALRFNEEGSVLAVGGEDGHLRVFKWPSMTSIIDEARAHTAVKDLDFSPDGKFLVSLGSGGPCRVWDVTSSAVITSLPKENDEIFGYCRFSQINDTDLVLFTTVMQGQGGSIVTWNTTSWKRISSKRIVRDAISAFDVSADGKFLAIGTVQGDIWIINSSNLRVHTLVKKAHLGFVTTLMLSKDSRALVSASLDSSARVTLVTKKEKSGFKLWIILLILVVVILALGLTIEEEIEFEP